MKNKNSMYWLVFYPLLMILSCGLKEKNHKEQSALPSGEKNRTEQSAFPYDLQHPEKNISLPGELNEISGIFYSNSESVVYAIEDEDGLLYKFTVTDNVKPQAFRF